jgi:hypothetical protein
MKRQQVIRKENARHGNEYHVDGLGTIGFLFGLGCVGIILYSIVQVIFS